MAHPRQRAPFRNAGARRQSLWIGGNSFSTVMAAASTPVLIASLNAAALALRPFTIVRTRGMLNLRSDQTGALEAYEAAYGHIVVSDQAVNTGIGVIPTPVQEDASDFHVYERRASQFTFISGVGIDSVSGLSWGFDSKAMRKVDNGEDVAIVCETSPISLGAMLISHFRMLVKLH